MARKCIFWSLACEPPLPRHHVRNSHVDYCAPCMVRGCRRLGQWPNTTGSHIKWPKLIMFNVYMGNGFRGRQPSSTAAIICLFERLCIRCSCFFHSGFVYLMQTRLLFYCPPPDTLPFSVVFFRLYFNFLSCQRLDFKYSRVQSGSTPSVTH